MKTLFGITLEQMRAQFVRQAVAQRDAFDTENPAMMIAQQRSADQPDTRFWQVLFRPRVLLLDTIRSSAFDLIARYCTNISFADPGIENQLRPMVRSLATNRNHALKLYHATDARLLAVVTGEDLRDTGFLFEPMSGRARTYACTSIPSDVTVENPDIRDFACALVYAEWCAGRPRKEEARRMLCDLGAHALEHATSVASQTFDKAVAVTPDLQDSVMADHVLVLAEPGSGEPHRLYDARAFRARKISISGGTPRNIWGTSGMTLEEAIEAITQPNASDIHGLFKPYFSQACCQIRDNGNILVIAARCCPNPLPRDGHMEIRL